MKKIQDCSLLSRQVLFGDALLSRELIFSSFFLKPSLPRDTTIIPYYIKK